ncbi:MAG: hypothetical protein NTV88_04075, partial [Candidatus Micrarchaeota archaeon]|nr:hypothetical protein [Candidatus Micrarchaeota archaeon]
KRLLAAYSESAGSQDAQDRAAAAQVQSDFASLRSQTTDLLTKYTASYSSLTGASKKKLPLTPSELEKRISSAEKTLTASQKTTLSGAQSLQMANDSYGQLQSAYDAMDSSLSSLQSVASSSLDVAKTALVEVKSKAGAEDAPVVAQIEAEADKSQELFANALYADSLMSSDRAIAAANAFLTKKVSGGLDAKTLLLAAVSLIFIGLAAYYFLSRNRPHKEKKEKHELPKGEE